MLKGNRMRTEYHTLDVLDFALPIQDLGREELVVVEPADLPVIRRENEGAVLALHFRVVILFDSDSCLEFG